MRIIRFTALWCADCIVMRPRWQAVFAARPDVAIEDFDFDDNEDQVAKFSIVKVPQLIVLNDDDKEVDRFVGMQDQEDLNALLEKYFNSK